MPLAVSLVVYVLVGFLKPEDTPERDLVLARTNGDDDSAAVAAVAAVPAPAGPTQAPPVKERADGSGAAPPVKKAADGSGAARPGPAEATLGPTRSHPGEVRSAGPGTEGGARGLASARVRGLRCCPQPRG